MRVWSDGAAEIVRVHMAMFVLLHYDELECVCEQLGLRPMQVCCSDGRGPKKSKVKKSVHLCEKTKVAAAHCFPHAWA